VPEDDAARYRSLFERVPVGLFRTRPDGTIEDANPALVRMLGHANEDALRAVNLRDLYVDPDDRRVLLERLEREGAASYELRMRRADGAIVWVRGSSRLVRDADGNRVHYEGHLEDITAERIAEQGLRLVQEMALELEGAGDFPAVLGASLRKICRAAGWSYGEAWVPNPEATTLVASESWFTTSEKAKKFRHLSAKLEFPPGVGAAGLAWQTRKTVWWPDAVHEPQFQRAAAAKAAGFRALCAVPVLNDGRLVAVLVFLTDVARDAERWVRVVESVARQLGTVMGRRVAEDVLRRQTRVLEAHLEASPDGVLVVSDAGEVVACNRRLLEMCEVAMLDGATSPSRWTGQALLALVDDPARFQARVRFLYEDPGEEDELVVSGRRFRRTAVPVRDLDDFSWGRIWTFRELPPRKPRPGR
jgi:PAS domain S-box-containing protein